MVRRLPILVLVALLVLTSQPPWRGPVNDSKVIDGPYALLLSSSTDLGPSQANRLRISAALNTLAEPEVLIGWAARRGLTVRWRPGDAWAVVEGAPTDLSKAFDVTVHDYRGVQGQIFYASRQQPAIPAPVRAEVNALGRILGYSPHHQAVPPILPMDLPDFGLTPTMLLHAYNANPLSDSGFTGKGQTIVVFAFDGYAQSDLDLFAANGPFRQFGPDFGPGPPSAANLEIALDMDQYVNSFRWKGDPPR